MKKLISCFLFLLIVEQVAFSSAIYDTRTMSSANKNSRISSDNTYKKIDYSAAIKEIQGKISQNPKDYILNTYLIDLYLKSALYQNAYDELIFLCNLSENKKLKSEVSENLSKIKNVFLRDTKVIQGKFYANLDLALMSIITADGVQAEKYVVAASKNIENEKAFSDTLNFVFRRLNNLENSITVFDKMLVQNPDNIAIKKMKALYLKQLKRNDEAIKIYQAILKSSPDDVEIIHNLYKIYEEKNVSQQEIIKRIFGKDNLEKAYSVLIELLMQEEDIQGAQNLALRCVKEFPDNPDAYIALSEIYRRAGKLKESYDVLKVVRDKADTNERISKYNILLAKLSDEPVQEANSLMNSGLYEQALSVLNEANSDNLYVILSKSRAYYFLGKKQTSLELLNRAMSFYPDNADVFYYFSFYFYQEKDAVNARKYVNKTLSISPNHVYGLRMLDLVNKLESDKYVQEISSCIELQNYTEAMRLTNEALSINSKDSQLYFYKGLIHICMNNYNLATGPLYKSLELNKGNYLAYFYLALCFDNLSDEGNALSYYRKFVDSVPVDDYGESERLKYANARIQKLSKPITQSK